MTTNELKKGDRVKLRNGWFATIMDNLKGNTRLADVEGYCREIGSVYSHDIEFYIPQANGRTLPFSVRCTEAGEDPIKIEHTPAQLKLKKRVESLGL